MICQPCQIAADTAHLLPFAIKDKDRNDYFPQSHDNCLALVKDKSWCDCQHKEVTNAKRSTQGGDKEAESLS